MKQVVQEKDLEYHVFAYESSKEACSLIWFNDNFDGSIVPRKKCI